MTGHIVILEPNPDASGVGVRCIPHGPIGAWGSHLEAFLHALEHDYAFGGGSCQ